jgi:hypothetical protein
VREGLETVARTAKVAVTHPVDTMSTVGGEAVRAASGAAHRAARLAGSGARLAGGVAESCLARVGLVGRDGVTGVVWDTDEVAEDVDRGAPAEPTVAEPSIEDAAAEAVARQEARAAAESAARVRRVAALAEQDDDPRTPSGIPAADEGFNPDTNETDLVQPDTVDPTDEGALHAIESEAETLRAAAQEKKS